MVLCFYLFGLPDDIPKDQLFPECNLLASLMELSFNLFP